MSIDASKFLCYECVGDSYLSKEIRDEGSLEKCTYCHKRQNSLPLQQIADRFHEVFCELYREEEALPTFTIDDDSPDWHYFGSTPEELIRELLGIDERIVEDIYNLLEAEYKYDAIRNGGVYLYDRSTYYVEINISTFEYSDLWESFCSRIKHRQRFFDNTAKYALEAIFSEIENYRSHSGKAAVRTIHPSDADSFIYRARQADGHDAIRRICLAPDTELGPPPQSVATAGRMNPVGISVFYGAFDQETCIAEIRLPVGGTAVVGQFEFIRPLHILDLTVFDDYPEALSSFDPDYLHKSSHLAFLATFHREIRKPVLPRDEVLDYIPTQAVAEYLATQFVPPLDGLIFSSAQNDGKGRNIVIFNHAAKVEVPRALSEGKSSGPTFKNYFDEDAMEFVIETILETDHGPTLDTTPKEQYALIMLNSENLFEEPENPPALRFVPDSIVVFKVGSIQHTTQTFSIFQHTRERRNDLPF